MYARYIKRPMDFVLSLCALIVLSPLLLILTIVGAVVMRGNPFFVQARPGKDEKLFKLVKFRTMSNARDKNGNLLPDSERLSRYGRVLRASSCDELPSLVNIIGGSLSIVGPRPQLVRDMVFMTAEQRKRHRVRPGLTGLAQVNGRNGISWERKLEYDLQYIENSTFIDDWKIIFMTVAKVFKRSGISAAGVDTSEDFGDYLLRSGIVTEDEYEKKQEESKQLLSIK